MNRRGFLGGAAALAATALLPMRVPLEPMPLPTIAIDPGYTWGMDIKNHVPVMMVGGDTVMYCSQDGGVTWEPVALWSNREPSQECEIYDSNFGLHVG